MPDNERLDQKETATSEEIRTGYQLITTPAGAMRKMQASTNTQTISFEQLGILPANTDEQNRVALQAAMDLYSPLGGATFFGKGEYPLKGPIVCKNNIKIKGNNYGDVKAPRSRKGSFFIITDTQNNVFTLDAVVGFTLMHFAFDYPNQPLQTTTPGTSLIQYPSTIYGVSNIYNYAFFDLQFVGAWSFIEMGTAPGALNNADGRIERIAGFPLSGKGIYIKNCVDITRIVDCMFSPSVGNYYRPLGVNPTGHPSICHSFAVMAFVMDSTNSIITWENTDELFMIGNFAYAYPTFIKTINSYGTIYQTNCDIGKVGLNLNNGAASKQMTVYGFSVIGSGGADASAANRNHVIIAGDGYYNFYGIMCKLGNDAFAMYSNPNNNSVIRIENTGAPYVNIYGVQGTNLQGTYTYDIQNLNSNAVIRAFSLNINSVTNRFTNFRKEDNIIGKFLGLSVADSGYYNFGNTTGQSGYGLRDNNGTIQYKNEGGVWTDLGGTPSGATETVVLDALFNGDAGTTLESYVPDIGTITYFGGTPILSGSGSLSMVFGDLLRRELTPGADVILEHFFTPAANHNYRSVMFRTTSGYYAAQLNIGADDTIGTLHLMNVGDIVETVSGFSTVGITMLKMTLTGDNLVISVNNAANTSLNVDVAGAQFNNTQFDSQLGNYLMNRLTVTEII